MLSRTKTFIKNRAKILYELAFENIKYFRRECTICGLKISKNDSYRKQLSSNNMIHTSCMEAFRRKYQNKGD